MKDKNEAQDYVNYHYPLFEYLSKVHNLILVDSELDEIIEICESMSNAVNEDNSKNLIN